MYEKKENGKSAGLDNIYLEVIKNISDFLIQVITEFFNRIQHCVLSLSTNSFSKKIIERIQTTARGFRF